MKTVMQELYLEIENIEKQSQTGLISLIDLERMFGNYYFQKEKQQIVNAYIEASANLEDIIKEAAEEYYKNTYENK